MGPDEDGEHTTRIRSVKVSCKGPEMRIIVECASEDEALELGNAVVVRFQEDGACTLELTKTGALQ